MAAAAYGSVVSLMHLLDNLHHPSRQHLHYDRSQIQTLGENLSFLLSFLENYSQILCHEDTIDLARKIFHVVDEAEEIIDYHVVDQLSQRSAYDVDKGLSSFREDLYKVLSEMESIKKELMIVKDREKPTKDQQTRLLVPAAGSLSVPPSSGMKNNMVGFENRLAHIMDQLTGDERNLQIVPITGMGGIGKTTLAQNVFDDRRIVNHFDLRKWTTISESFSIQQILQGLLGEKSNGNNEESDKNYVAELGGKLHKRLFGMRYLIVMDDVWSEEVWDDLRFFFPNNKNGSRILVTARLTKVAVSLSSQETYLMDFMDKGTSWKLFCMKAFGKEDCSYPELEEIGKNIVECCKGLPLAIATVGGLLGKSNVTRDDWELVAKDVLKSIDNSKDDYEDCSGILSLSYKHLPIHLKPCFVYLRVFPEDFNINAPHLIRHWVAHGFVKPKDGKTLEDVALEYLKDLIDRNLILIHQMDVYGDISVCKVHDLLRDLCLREYENEHCFSPSKIGDLLNAGDPTCSLCSYRKPSTWIDLPQVSSTITPLQTTTHVSCFVCDVCNVMCSNRNRLRLAKVAHSTSDRTVSTSDRTEYLKPTRLRYFAARNFHIGFESTALNLLWNLQFLDHTVSEVEIPAFQQMPQLRLLFVDCALCVDHTSTKTDKKDDFILKNLHGVDLVLDKLTVEFLKRVPNVTSLTIRYDCSTELVLQNQPLHHVANLRKLNFLISSGVDLEYISFPKTLNKLDLRFCNCPWERMTVVGSLPNLEVLILCCTYGGPEWNPNEGEFRRLKTLVILDIRNLMQWNVEKDHFPRLEILELEGVQSLEKIPSEIGDIETLREIRLRFCSKSLIQSVEEIIAEQREYGNEELQLVF